MKDRAYSFLEIKEINSEKRIFSGMATTPEADRVGDVVDPLGAKFADEIPLLWMHDHSLPVGFVKLGKPTKKGVPFEARIPTVDGPQTLKDRVDEAWSSVKIGLIKAVSIGFRALEWSIDETTGGYNFLETEILELSLVSVPANSQATITAVKSIDRNCLKTLSSKTVKLRGENTMKISEQIKNLKELLKVKNAKLSELAAASAEKGETFDDAQKDEFDGITKEVGEITDHLKRLEIAEKAQINSATAVDDKAGQNQDDAKKARQGTYAQVKVSQTYDKGIPFARLAKCKALSKMHNVPAHDVATQLFADDPRIANILKTAVVAGSTLSGNWASALVGEETTVFADFAEFLRPMTILGKFGTNGIPALRNVPFRVPLLAETEGGEAQWVGEGKAKPLTKSAYSRTTLTPLKVAGICVVTKELIQASSPSAELLLRDMLAKSIQERLDIDFILPSKAVSADVSPASITHGVSPVPSTGDDADAVRCDVQGAMAGFIEANNPPTTGVWLMSSRRALALSLMRNALGQPEFPGITMAGGTFAGLPAIVSEYVPADSTGDIVVLANAADIYLGDEGGVAIDMSDQASLEMADDASHDSITPTPSELVSMFQTNSVAFRAERTINWKKRRASAVSVITGVNWGACPAS